jgi:hypothetical protein
MGTAREHVKNKGFWDGGSKSHAGNGQSGGRASGYPGTRLPSTSGVRVDLEFPNTDQRQEPKN